MNNKKLLIGILCLFGFMFAISLASASVTVQAPVASAVLTGTVGLNASGVALDNCTFYAKSASTANSSWTVLKSNVENESDPATRINTTFNSAVLEDSNDYIFNATCYNSSGSYHEGTRSGITIDNTSPRPIL